VMIFFFQAEDGIRDFHVTGVQTCALPISAFIIVLGVHYWIGRYGVLLDGSGFGGTVGYADVHARLPARTVIALCSLIAAGSIVRSEERRVGKEWGTRVLRDE